MARDLLKNLLFEVQVRRKWIRKPRKDDGGDRLVPALVSMPVVHSAPPYPVPMRSSSSSHPRQSCSSAAYGGTVSGRRWSAGSRDSSSLLMAACMFEGLAVKDARHVR